MAQLNFVGLNNEGNIIPFAMAFIIDEEKKKIYKWALHKFLTLILMEEIQIVEIESIVSDEDIT